MAEPRTAYVEFVDKEFPEEGALIGAADHYLPQIKQIIEDAGMSPKFNIISTTNKNVMRINYSTETIRNKIGKLPFVIACVVD